MKHSDARAPSANDGSDSSPSHGRDATFSERLQVLVGRAGSTSALARKASVSRRMIDKYLAGAEPTREKLIALANAGNVSIEWLATGRESGTMVAVDHETPPRGPAGRRLPKAESASEFAERVQRLVDRAGGAAKLAERAGISRQMVELYAKGRGEPTREKLISLARAGNVSVQWLAEGIRPPGVLANEYVALPRYDVRASAGPGSIVAEPEQVVEWIHFQREWLHRTVGGTEGLVMVEAEGRSMSPTIEEGDLLIIDITEPRLRREGIYLFALDDNLLVKRVILHPDGQVVIRSDNQGYQAEVLRLSQREAAERMRVLGRVVWVGGPV